MLTITPSLFISGNSPDMNTVPKYIWHHWCNFSTLVRPSRGMEKVQCVVQMGDTNKYSIGLCTYQRINFSAMGPPVVWTIDTKTFTANVYSYLSLKWFNCPDYNCVLISCSYGVFNYLKQKWLSFAVGTTCRTDCQRGYERVGPSSRTCLNTGQWSDQPASCKRSYLFCSVLHLYCFRLGFVFN